MSDQVKVFLDPLKKSEVWLHSNLNTNRFRLSICVN